MTRERERKEERRTIRRKVPTHLPPLLLENASKKRKKGREERWGKTFSKKCNAIEGRADQEGIAENVGGQRKPISSREGVQETRYRRVFSLATDTIGNRFACEKIFSKEKNDQREGRWLRAVNDAIFLPLFFLSSSSLSLSSLFCFFQSAKFRVREPFEFTIDLAPPPSFSDSFASVWILPSLSGVWARLIVSYSISLHYGGYVRGTTAHGIIFRSHFHLPCPPNVLPFSRAFIRFVLITTIRGKTWNNSFTGPRRPENVTSLSTCGHDWKNDIKILQLCKNFDSTPPLFQIFLKIISTKRSMWSERKSKLN